MNKENAIEVKNLKKSFKIYYDKGSELKERVLFRMRNRFEKREVLNGISFNVKKGEAVGLVGHNGCGKSTTLKLLTQIIYPDEGTIEMRGRVSSLIELGAGFHPDMSGRENIYTNAAIFGLNRREIDARLDDIIRFSELGSYIENPVRTYSSGMYARLAFSVAINVDADILLVDEILSVGDAGFQRKCFNKLEEISSEGVSIVIVSHDIGSIEKFCDRAIWIHEGRIRMMNEPVVTCRSYQQYMLNGEESRNIFVDISKNDSSVNDKAEDQKIEDNETKDGGHEEGKNEVEERPVDNNRWGSGEVIIEDAYITNSGGKRVGVVKYDEPIAINVKYKVLKEQKGYNIGFGFYKADGTLLYGTNTTLDGYKINALYDGAKAIIRIPGLKFAPGEYYLQTAIVDKYDKPLDFYKYYSKFEVLSAETSIGLFAIDHKWEIYDGKKTIIEA